MLAIVLLENNTLKEKNKSVTLLLSMTSEYLEYPLNSV